VGIWIEMMLTIHDVDIKTNAWLETPAMLERAAIAVEILLSRGKP